MGLRPTERTNYKNCIATVSRGMKDDIHLKPFSRHDGPLDVIHEVSKIAKPLLLLPNEVVQRVNKPMPLYAIKKRDQSGMKEL